MPERQAGDVGQVHAARHPEVVQGGDVRGDAGGHQGPGVPFNSLTLDAIKGTNLVRLWAKFGTRAGKNSIEIAPQMVVEVEPLCECPCAEEGDGVDLEDRFA